MCRRLFVHGVEKFGSDMDTWNFQGCVEAVEAGEDKEVRVLSSLWVCYISVFLFYQLAFRRRRDGLDVSAVSFAELCFCEYWCHLWLYPGKWMVGWERADFGRQWSPDIYSPLKEDETVDETVVNVMYPFEDEAKPPVLRRNCFACHWPVL
jgi:hypothetical protein